MCDEHYEGGEIFDADAIPLSDDQMRALARIAYSDTGKSILAMIDSLPLTYKMKSGLKNLAVTNLSRDTIFAHNTSVTSIMSAYKVSVIQLDLLKSPKDAESNELPPFLSNLQSLVLARVSRTVGGKSQDERTLQYNPTTRVEQVQRIESAPIPREPEADEGGL